MASEEASVRVYLPRALREYSGGADAVDVDGETLAQALARLDALHPGLGERILDDQGQPREYVFLFVNHERVRDEAVEAVPLKAGDEVHVFPSVQGG